MTIEVVKYRDLIPILSIPRFVAEFSQPTIEIRGEDFSSVDRVFVNDSPSPEFIIINKHTMYVQLPEGAKKQICNIEVLSSKFTKTTKSSKMQFEFGNKTRSVTGLMSLIQLFTKWILQSPGSDIFNPERGGGLQELVGQVTSTKRMDSVLGTVSRAVQNTVTQIRTAQIRASNLALDERLLAADVVDLQVYEKQMEAVVKVGVRSVAGQEAVTGLEL